LITNVFSEVEMNAKVFDRPVYLKERRELIREITCLEDAIDFLEEWPERDRDIVHDATLKTCYMAWDSHKPLNVARDAPTILREEEGYSGQVSRRPAVDDQSEVRRRAYLPVKLWQGGEVALAASLLTRMAAVQS
jgi:hypothetical protein